MVTTRKLAVMHRNLSIVINPNVKTDTWDESIAIKPQVVHDHEDIHDSACRLYSSRKAKSWAPIAHKYIPISRSAAKISQLG